MSEQAIGRQSHGGRRHLHTLLGLLVGGLFLYLSLRGVDLEAAWEVLRGISPLWLPALVSLLLVGFWLKSLRWRWMFPADSAPTRREAFDAFMIGALGNNLLPGRLGDVLRAAVLGRNLREIGTGGALASIVLEKVLDGMVLLGMLALVLVLAPLPAWLTHAGLLGLAGFCAVLVALLIINAAGSSSRLAGWVQGRRGLQFLFALIQRLGNGLHGLRSPGRMAALVLLSVVVWGIETLILFLAFRVFGLVLPLEAAVVGIVLLSVGTMLPAAPGFVGTYQFFLLTALALYQVPQEVSLALGIFLNLLIILVTTLVGLVTIFREGGVVAAFRLGRAAT